MDIFFNINEIWTSLNSLPFGNIKTYKNTAIIVENGKIKKIDEQDKLFQEFPSAHQIDCLGLNLMPGFVDPHTHPIFYKTREDEFIMRGQGKDYEEIAAAGGGIRNSVRTFRMASYQELLELSTKRVTKFLEFGTTTIEAKSGYGLSLKDEIKALEIIKELQKTTPLTLVPTFLGAHEIPDEFRDNKNLYVDLICNEMIPQVAQKGLAKFCDVFCEKNVFEIEDSRKILLAAKKHNLIPKLHADELHPIGGAELAAEVKAISADHLLKASEKGIEKMKKAGVTPVILPGTAFFLGKKEYAPVKKMINYGLDIALATDYNPGSCHTQNMQMMLTLAVIYLGMTPSQYIDASTRISARAIGLENEVGTIEIGKNADFILVTAENMAKLSYHFGVNHVKTVYKNGELVKTN